MMNNIQWPTPLRYFIAVLLIFGCLGILVFIRPVGNVVAFGFVFAFLFYTPIRKLSEWLGDKFGLATGLFYLVVIVLLVLLIITGVEHIAISLQGLHHDLTPAIATVQLPAPIPEMIISGVKASSVWLLKTLEGIISGLVSTIGLVFVSLFFSALLLLNLHQARGALRKWVPEQGQNEVRQILFQLDQVWVGFMTAQIIYGTVLGAASWVEFALLGVPYAFLMAVVTGLISLIPTIGGLLSSLIVAIPCLLLGSTVLKDMNHFSFTLLVYVINVLTTQISYNFVALPVIGKFVRLPVAAVFLGVLAGVAMGNILLAFLVVPILSTLTIIGGYLLSRVAGRSPTLEPTPKNSKETGFFSQMLMEEPNIKTQL